MAITIKGKSGNAYSFDGSFQSSSSLENKSGVYAILDQNGTGLNLLDVGESANVRDRVENHDRSDCWRRNHRGIIKFSAFYVSSEIQRMDVEQDIRGNFNLPCGER